MEARGVKANGKTESVDDDDVGDARERRRRGNVVADESVKDGDEEEASTQSPARKVV